MKDEGITDAILLRESETERDYLVETSTGTKLVTLKKATDHWFVAEQEMLRANEAEETPQED